MRRRRERKRPATRVEPSRSPRTEASAPGDHKPRLSAQPDEGLTPTFSFSRIDIGGPWCWSELTPDHIRQAFLRLGQFEAMTWQQLRQARCHLISVDQLTGDAQRRLQELYLDDFDALWSLRLTGRRRIWCAPSGRVLLLLWWDPDHQVCPSELRHT